jgi:hypothetical protein
MQSEKASAPLTRADAVEAEEEPAPPHPPTRRPRPAAPMTLAAVRGGGHRRRIERVLSVLTFV